MKSDFLKKLKLSRREETIASIFVFVGIILGFLIFSVLFQKYALLKIENELHSQAIHELEIGEIEILINENVTFRLENFSTTYDKTKVGEIFGDFSSIVEGDTSDGGYNLE